MSDSSEDRSNIVWACPQCGYLVADVAYTHIIIDAPCPRGCGTVFSDFHSRRFPRPVLPPAATKEET